MASHDNMKDWREGLSLLESCDHMLTNQITTDVAFSVGEAKETITAHRFILVCRSAVFQSMLSGDFSDGKDLPIEVPDVEPCPFKEMLRFMYSDHVEITGENVLSLLYTSKKYAVHQLVKLCMSFLTDGQTPENVCSILEQAHFYSEPDFIAKTTVYILEHGSKVLQGSGFLDLCPDCLSKIVASDDLRCEESVVFESVTRWAQQQCEKAGKECNSEIIRETLGSLLYCVRFPLLDKAYYTNVVSECEFLTDHEKVDLFKCFYKKGGVSSLFSSKKRAVSLGGAMSRQSEPKPQHVSYVGPKNGPSILTCMRFGSVCEDGSWYCGGETDAITFLSSCDILLHGILVYGAYIGEGRYDVRCVVMDNSDAELIKCNTTIRTTEQQLTYVILFDDTVSLSCDKKYTVSVKLLNSEGVDTYQGLNGSVTVKVGDVKFVFSKTRYSRNGTDVKIGQIPGLLFSINK